jgi:hypothetical protein
LPSGLSANDPGLGSGIGHAAGAAAAGEGGDRTDIDDAATWARQMRRAQGTLYEQIISACAAAGFTPRLVCEGAEIYTLVRLVEAGLPLYIGPNNEGIVMEAGLIWRRGRYRSQAALTLAEIIQEVAEPASASVKEKDYALEP